MISGGQFLRAYVERYNRPPVNNLITFGSQHMGVSDLPACHPYDFLCQIARRVAKGAVYGTWAQENVVQVRSWLACIILFKQHARHNISATQTTTKSILRRTIF